MTRDEIIKLARDAGFVLIIDSKYGCDDYLSCQSPLPSLERFAALVAASERESCAKAAEGFPENRDWVPGSLWGNIRADVASAIRARGEK